MKLAKLTIISAALIVATGAQADTFNFSYTFGNGSVATGSFDGTANGNLVTDLSNIHVALNGEAFTGTIYGSSWGTNYNYGYGYWQSGGAVASFDGTQNNFMFINADFPNSTPSGDWTYFYAIPYYQGNTTDAFAYTYHNGVNSYGQDYNGYTPGNWTLTNVSAVPEPESFALMLAGLGLMGAVARRRKNGTA